MANQQRSPVRGRCTCRSRSSTLRVQKFNMSVFWTEWGYSYPQFFKFRVQNSNVPTLISAAVQAMHSHCLCERCNWCRNHGSLFDACAWCALGKRVFCIFFASPCCYLPGCRRLCGPRDPVREHTQGDLAHVKSAAPCPCFCPEVILTHASRLSPH